MYELHFPPAIQALTAVAVVLGLVPLLLPLARRFQLVDKPGQRKNHSGAVPLLGGLAIYLCLIITLPLFHSITASHASFIIAGGLLVAVGVLDDRFGLPVRYRFLIEILAACIMIFGAGLWVGNLGDLLGIGTLNMPFLIGLPFTLVAVFGILNAINMVDGIDGSAGGITLIALTWLLFQTSNSPDLNTLGPLLCGALAGFLLCNLKILPFLPKVFLGDAGSKLLGLCLVWFAIDVAESGSRETGGIEPATALYAVGLPLFDMVTTTLRRLRKRVSPVTPDRTHIHHIFQRAGFSNAETLAIILALAASFNFLGFVLTFFNVAEFIQFSLFFGLFICYSYTTHRVFRLSIRLRRAMKNPR